MAIYMLVFFLLIFHMVSRKRKLKIKQRIKCDWWINIPFVLLITVAEKAKYNIDNTL